jgi:hypothetical protein
MKLGQIEENRNIIDAGLISKTRPIRESGVEDGRNLSALSFVGDIVPKVDQQSCDGLYFLRKVVSFMEAELGYSKPE